MLKKELQSRFKKYPADEAYLKVLAAGAGLQPSEIYKLYSIMGGEELQDILRTASYENFLGDDDCGISRFNLHIHTNASDGKMRPQELLDVAVEYLRRYRPEKMVLAVTDHDRTDSCREIVHLLAADPEKYAGIRFVLGCELSVAFINESLRQPVDFELLYYGLNPFDGDLERLLESLSDSRKKALPEVLSLLKERFGTAPDIEVLRQNSPNLRKGTGCNFPYEVYQQMSVLVPEERQEELRNVIFGLDGLADGCRQYVLHRTVDDIVGTVKRSGFGFLSMAHPPRLVLSHRLNQSFADRENAGGFNPGFTFVAQLFDCLVSRGMKGFEYYYGNFKNDLNASFFKIVRNQGNGGASESWMRYLFGLCEQYGLIKTGGYDTHNAVLFDNPLQRALRCWYDTQALISEGYRVLDKEMSMSLPGPCFPPLSACCDTGIGSPYGSGAVRIEKFFNGAVDKILLGPAGKTNAAAKHSPYVSDTALNPFMIPLEKLAEDGLLEEELLEEIYRKDKSSESIDFDQVEADYGRVLGTVLKHRKKNETEDEFFDCLVKKYADRCDYKYIGDIQVQIPHSIVCAHPEAFLEGFTLGSPPDVFGQARNWGFKVFDPAKIFNVDGSLGIAGKIMYDIFDRTFRLNKGGMRIDHYIGMVDPYVFSENPAVPSGRLYSSPDNPILRKYAKHSVSEFANITTQIILKAAEKNHLGREEIYLEDVGTRPEVLDDVIDYCGLGRLLVAQFVEIDDDAHCYRLKNGRRQDVAALDTHDTPSIHNFYRSMDEQNRARYAVKLAADLRFDYNQDLNRPEQLIRMQWGALLASPCRRVQAFFTSFTGQDGRYNQPGNPIKWKLRCRADFDRLYFRNLTAGTAYNPLDAIALAIYARGDAFFEQHRGLVDRLRERERELLRLAREV